MTEVERMKIYKGGFAETGVRDEISLVNTFAKTQLAAEDVYTFSVLLCDNEVDRDFERFSDDTLKELAELFVGKTGISDHDWSSGRQKARIYRTELVTDEIQKNSLGDPYMYLKGYAYMLRTENNAELIAEIEGGIRRETSVGCAVSKSICSICGTELGNGECGHCKGHEYDGIICHWELCGATDAYEWSFVAVPAQKNAGVMKRYAQEKGFSGGDSMMEKQAALGRKYLSGLQRDVLRLSLLVDEELHSSIAKRAEKMDEDSLLALKGMFEKQLEAKFPPLTQIPGKNDITRFDGDEYIV